MCSYSKPIGLKSLITRFAWQNCLETRLANDTMTLMEKLTDFINTTTFKLLKPVALTQTDWHHICEFCWSVVAAKFSSPKVRSHMFLRTCAKCMVCSAAYWNLLMHRTPSVLSNRTACLPTKLGTSQTFGPNGTQIYKRTSDLNDDFIK